MSFGTGVLAHGRHTQRV